MAKNPIVILGAGLAGLSAATSLRKRGVSSVLYEQHERPGGHTRSHSWEGFVFDEGPHVSFTKHPEMQQLFAASAGSHREFLSTQLNYYRGTWLKHPAICHLHGLPVEIVERCLVDAINAQRQPHDPPRHYGEWLQQGCGEFFTQEFATRYTRKYWTVEPEELSTDWVAPRVYRPSIEEVVRGALAPTSQALHYIQECRYPTRGGYEAYTRLLREGCEVQTNCLLEEVDVHRHRLTFANGRTASYGMLVSSIPLPVLVRAIPDAPPDVRQAAEVLRWTSLRLINVGVRRATITQAHWMYFYDEEIVFSRVSFPHLLSPANVPPGCGSIQAEIYYAPWRPLPEGDLVQRTLEDLRRVGLLRADDDIVVAVSQDISFANVICDHAREHAVACLQTYLRSQDIYPCGRYGEWGYLWSDQAVLSGQRIAEELTAEEAPLAGRIS